MGAFHAGWFVWFGLRVTKQFLEELQFEPTMEALSSDDGDDLGG